MRLPWFDRPKKGGISQTFKEFIDFGFGKQGSLNSSPSSQQDDSGKRVHRKTKLECAPAPGNQKSDNTNAPSSNRDTVPPFPAPSKLKRFHKTASTQEMRRFSDLKDRLESPLLEHMNKYKGAKPHQLSPIALRPIMLGTTLVDAKLWMVILCDKDLESRASKFLRKRWVYELCNPPGHNQTNIEILVAGSVWPVSRILAQLPLKPANSGNNDWTFCGVPMCFFDTENHSIRMGTLGGPLRVWLDDGQWMLMGMTSGHAMQNFGGCDSSGPDVENRDTTSDSESEPESSDHSHSHGRMTYTLQPSLDNQKSKPAAQIRANLWEASSAMLPIVTSAKIEDGVNKYYDWTLVQLTDMPLPNRHGRPIDRVKPLQVPKRTVLERLEEVPVLVLSAEGQKPGYLCATPAQLQMHPGESFINTHLIRLHKNYCESMY